MRAITLLFILAISFNSITSSGGYFDESVYKFYERTDRPLGLKGINTDNILHLMEWIVNDLHSSQRKHPDRYVSREDLELSNPSIREFAIELSKLKEFQNIEYYKGFPVNYVKDENRFSVARGEFDQVDELLIADELIDILDL